MRSLPRPLSAGCRAMTRCGTAAVTYWTPCWQQTCELCLQLRGNIDSVTTPGRLDGGIVASRKRGPMSEDIGLKKGRARGIEPPNSGATSHCLNLLATPAAQLGTYNISGW